MTLLPTHREGPSRAGVRELADEELMGLVREGEMAAFEVIYDRHSRVAFSLAYRICGTRSSAEDVVQEAFLALWRSGARYDRTRGSVRTWVLGIVHNRAIDALRRNVVHDRRRASDDGIAERLEAPEPRHAVEQLDAHLAVLGVARVHAGEVGGKKGRFVSADAGADFDDGVARIVFIRGNN